MRILSEIIQSHTEGKKLLAILIDPDKMEVSNVASFFSEVNRSAITHILVGGSEVAHGKTETLVKKIKEQTTLPIVLFPGDVSQITEYADGLLFLSLLSGENPEYLVAQQVKAAHQLKETSLEVMPTGYLLIDGGVETAVQRVSETAPIANSDIDRAVDTAYAAQLMGKQLVYLEAGSGAVQSVPVEMIRRTKAMISIPLIVGGGIRDVETLENIYAAGADMVVIGTAFEQDARFFEQLQLKRYSL